MHVNTFDAFVKIKTKYFVNSIVIKSVEDANSLHKKLIDFGWELSINGIAEIMPHYRGEQDSNWDIRSGLFRDKMIDCTPENGKELEKKLVKKFEYKIIEKYGVNIIRNISIKGKYTKEWDLLFQAKHAGVKTTITDWSCDIDRALFFATEFSKDSSIENSNAQIWCLITPCNFIVGDSDEATFYDKSPYEIKSTYLINSPYHACEYNENIFEQRMAMQGGRFIIDPIKECNVPLNLRGNLKPLLLRGIIPAIHKQNIREELENNGLNRNFMLVKESDEMESLIKNINSGLME